MFDSMKGLDASRMVRRDDSERERNDTVMLSEHRRFVIDEENLEERLADLAGSIRIKVGLERGDIPDSFPDEKARTEFVETAMTRYGEKSGFKWMSDDEMRAQLNEYVDTATKFERAKDGLAGAGQSLKESDIFVRRRKEFGNLVNDRAIETLSGAVTLAMREAMELKGQKRVQENRKQQAEVRAEELRQNLNVLLSLKELMKEKHQDILERLDAIKVLRTVLGLSKAKAGQVTGEKPAVPEREMVELGNIIERNREEHQRIMDAARNAVMEGRYDLVGDIIAKLKEFNRQLISNMRRRCPSLLSEIREEIVPVQTPTPNVEEGETPGYVRMVVPGEGSGAEAEPEKERLATPEQIQTLKDKFGF